MASGDFFLPTLAPDAPTAFPPLSNNAPHVWTELPPIWRSGHSLVYDSRRDRFLVIGGPSDELWQFRTRPGPDAAWRRFSGKGEGPLDCGAAVYDAAQDRLLVYGLIEQKSGGRLGTAAGPVGSLETGER